MHDSDLNVNLHPIYTRAFSSACVRLRYWRDDRLHDVLVSIDNGVPLNADIAWYYTIAVILMSAVILAVDPGYDKLGYALFECSSPSPKLVKSGLIKTHRKAEHLDRLTQIVREVERLLASYDVCGISMEDLFFTKNAKTVIKVAQVQGVIYALAARHSLPVEIISPRQIKLAVTGNGAADKDAVWKMLKLQLRIGVLTADDDESDAIACGFAYCVQKLR
jgi:crossover junction endodeoxyribonuclease RuvC